MISYLEGTIKFKGTNFIILLVNGVGYKVYAPVDIISKFNINDPIILHTYTYVKEDALDLYGFISVEDQALFELFLGVSGVGPKTAIAIFGNGSVVKIKEAIVKGDIDFFAAVPRLGKKNAQKIIIDIRPKLGSLSTIDLTLESTEMKEIDQALRSFGFTATETKEAIKSLKGIEGDTSFKIKHALKYFGRANNR